MGGSLVPRPFASGVHLEARLYGRGMGDTLNNFMDSEVRALYSGARVSGGPFPSHASWAMGPDLWLTRAHVG